MSKKIITLENLSKFKENCDRRYQGAMSADADTGLMVSGNRIIKLPSINSFGLSPSVVEIGETISNVSASWNLSEVPTSLKLTGAITDTLSNLKIGSKSITGLSLRKTTDGQSESVTLEAVMNGATLTRSASIYWRYGAYFFNAAQDASEATLKAAVPVSSAPKALASSKQAIGTQKFNSEVNKAVFLAVPATFAKPDYKNESGLSIEVDEIVGSFALTVHGGVSAQYKIYRLTSNQGVVSELTFNFN